MPRAARPAKRQFDLVLVGAGTHPGADVPRVVNCAKATARVILEDFPA
jgi:phytoene dehydrogenase-like protein